MQFSGQDRRATGEEKDGWQTAQAEARQAGLRTRMHSGHRPEICRAYPILEICAALHNPHKLYAGERFHPS